jgi:phosphonate degradation associated HDIG domain protein
MDKIAELIAMLETKGIAQYGGEAVSQTQHALQCAGLAEREGAPDTLVAAALLHDVGHLLAKPIRAGDDDKHEDIGWGWLKSTFGPAVSEPVRLHVDAKRWLCASEAPYFATLSPASVRSLAVQGGPFTAEESAEFAGRPYASDAIRVRRWDDLAKDPAALTKPLSAYCELLRTLAR